MGSIARSATSLASTRAWDELKLIWSIFDALSRQRSNNHHSSISFTPKFAIRRFRSPISPVLLDLTRNRVQSPSNPLRNNHPPPPFSKIMPEIEPARRVWSPSLYNSPQCKETLLSICDSFVACPAERGDPGITGVLSSTTTASHPPPSGSSSRLRRYRGKFY